MGRGSFECGVVKICMSHERGSVTNLLYVEQTMVMACAWPVQTCCNLVPAVFLRAKLCVPNCTVCHFLFLDLVQGCVFTSLLAIKGEEAVRTDLRDFSFSITSLSA